MYKNTYEKVITPAGETDNFQITKGVLQDYTVATLCVPTGLHHMISH